MSALFDDNDDELTLTGDELNVNANYAARFEKRKQKQEIARLKERYGDEDDSDEEEAYAEREHYLRDYEGSSVGSECDYPDRDYGDYSTAGFEDDPSWRYDFDTFRDPERLYDNPILPMPHILSEP